MSLTYLRPRSQNKAVALLAEYGYDAKIISGGTALVLMLQQKLIAPAVLVSLARVPGLDYLRAGEEGLHIGANTTIHQVAQAPLVRERFPALSYACDVVGNIRVRQQATLAGNLAEADYASDPPAMLLALEAAVDVRGPSGERRIPLSDFFLGMYTTVLAPEEIISNIFIPWLPDQTRMTYRKFTTRSEGDRPCVAVAAVATMEDGICHDLRVAVGAATEIGRRLSEAEAMAHGHALGNELIGEIAAHYASRLDPLDDLRGSAWYRREMIRVEVSRALEEVRNGPQ